MLSREILRTLPQFVRLIRKLSKEHLEDSITMHHLRVLFLISEGAGPTQVADTLQISLPAISKVVNSLATKGLIKRSPGKDRRSLELRLTSKGRKTLRIVSGKVEKELDKGLDVLSHSERNELEKSLVLLNKLMNYLKEA